VPSDSCVNGSGGVSGQESRAIGGELGRRRWGRTSCGTTCWPHLVVPRRKNPGCQVEERIGCAAASHLMADPDAACRHADGEMDEAMMTDRGQAEQLPLPARPRRRAQRRGPAGLIAPVRPTDEPSSFTEYHHQPDLGLGCTRRLSSSSRRHSPLSFGRRDVGGHGTVVDLALRQRHLRRRASPLLPSFLRSMLALLPSRSF